MNNVCLLGLLALISVTATTLWSNQAARLERHQRIKEAAYAAWHSAAWFGGGLGGALDGEHVGARTSRAETGAFSALARIGIQPSRRVVALIDHELGVLLAADLAAVDRQRRELLEKKRWGQGVVDEALQMAPQMFAMLDAQLRGGQRGAPSSPARPCGCHGKVEPELGSDHPA